MTRTTPRDISCSTACLTRTVAGERPVGMYVVLVCPSCWYVPRVGMSVVLVCTSCWYVRRVGMYRGSATPPIVLVSYLAASVYAVDMAYGDPY
jgi:hypothetical protein